MRYDVAVIGGGPAGYVAAVTAVQHGLRVALVERRYLGGECSNWGCIPSKALIELGNALGSVKTLNRHGITVRVEGIDRGRVLRHVSRAVVKAREGVKYLLSEVEVIEGVGRLKDVHTVKVGDAGTMEVEASNIILATGTEPKTVPTFSFDGVRVIHNRHFFELDSLPNSIVIVGAGAIGCEISEALAQLGVEVHLVEIMGKILPEVDSDVSDVVSKYLVKSGVKIYTSSKAQFSGHLDNEVVVRISNDRGTTEVRAEKVLIAAGRSYNTKNLGLAEAGVELDDRGVVLVNDLMRTTVPNIYAAGDITGPPLLAHKAFREGMIAAEAIAGVEEPLPRGPIPMVIYTHPEVGFVGLSEVQAANAGVDYRVVKLPYTVLGRDSTSVKSTPDGFVKLVLDKNAAKILGVAIVGNGAADVIHLFSLAISQHLTLQSLRKAIITHPTYSELFSEVVSSALGRPLHVPKQL
ncbi:MAG: dihydrolipoyl dehydrogenase [Zestosphaera sp.]